ncbi:protein FAM83H-like isoform X1 [Salvelinus namaycush]|uniref:Protein FAM83H-like isoform X1 n=1 Tax=Salvelinus namaycush TaxID=8040 RepID=A0A8U0QQZ0_SALNM|nr:protein FAM83H-like isoform X1 [Salvelinus namaycush]XP_038847629.1 protein FAM83H-like isoform X1 [Salvelinus namaycush]
MAHRSQCSSAGDNPLDPKYLPSHFREEYRLAIDALVEDDLEGYYQFLQSADVVDFLSRQEIEHIRCTVQIPYQSTQPELPYVESEGDGSSDTYWPVHSDLDAPGLDLGWPQQHHFIGPTEVTTLVNPSEPDMPSIKAQARRLIKNAQQVIAVVMDTFTDVDIFADILDAAMRNVAVYIILDEQNAHHFTTMASNCRVNLESIQFMRVRTVSGITYRCRSGKSFKGQMLDRFLLTDCRAVLSGNYSFMWSFEKIHRCMAHLFLGQLVATFDEEFRILFAQSQPLVPENVLVPVPDYSSLSDSQYSTDRTPLFRDPRKFLPIESSRPKEWARHSFDDQKRMPPGRHEHIHRSLDQGSLDMYRNKYSSQQFRIEQQYFMEQGHPMMQSNTMDFAGSKRHSYAEGTYARHSSPQFMQHQAMDNYEEGMATQSRKIHREQHHHQRTGPEPGYGSYDQFSDQGYPPMDQYSESGYPHGIEIEPPDNYDPVVNYLSSSKLAVEMGHGSDKLSHPGEGPFCHSNAKRLSVGHPYACQTSPTQQNLSEQKQFFVGSGSDRKTQDPSAKQGMRDWRISSYLSAYDDGGEEDISQPFGNDPFEEPLNPSQGIIFAPLVSDPKFNAKELPKIAGLRLKTTRPEHSRTPDIIVSMATDEGDKSEDMDVKEPKREESFRRRFNPAIQRTSRLRSSLIFSSQLEQHISHELNLTSGQHCEETANEEDDQSRLSLTAQILGKRRSITREPFEWRCNKPATVDNSTLESLKSEDITTDAGDKELQNNPPVGTDMASSKEQPKPDHEEESKMVQCAHPSKSAQIEQPKTIQTAHLPSSLSNTLYIDMNDPDSRFKFFKELAAQRKAAKASESESSAEKAPLNPVTPFDLTTKDEVTSVEPTLPVAPLNPADTSTKKPSTSTEGPLKPEDASNKKTATSTEALLNPADTSTKKPSTSTEGPLKPEDASNKKTATSTETPPNPADTSTKKTATSTQASSETLETSPVSQENKTSMATHGSLHLDVKDKASKNKEHEELNLPKSDSKTFLRCRLSCDDGLLRVATDAEKIELKNSQNQSVSEVNPRDTSAFLEHTSKERGFNIAPKEFSLYKQSPKEPNSSNPASKELSPSLQLTLTEVSSSLSPTSTSFSLTHLTSFKHAAKDLSSALTPTLNESSSSNPPSKQQLLSSKPVTVESNKPLSPTQSASSVSSHPIPSKSSTFAHTIPLQSSPPIIPGPVEPVVSPKPDKTDSKEYLSPTPMQSCSSSIPAPATELSLLPSSTQTKSSSLPTSTLVGSTSSTPIDSNISPNPSTKESLFTIATTELKSPSPKTNPIKSYSSPSPGQDEFVLSPKPSKTASNSSPKPTTAEFNDSPNSSLPSPKHVTEQTNKSPILTPTQSSSSSNQTTREPNPYPNNTPTEPGASPDPTPTDSSASSNPSQTKSHFSPMSASGGSVLCPMSGQTKSITSPNLTPTEYCSSPNHTPTESTSPFNPVLVESNPSSNSNPTHSTASHDTVPAPSVIVDNSKKGKLSNLIKEQKAGSSPAAKGDKKAVDTETMSKTAPGESASHGPQSPNETKENDSTMKTESPTDQTNPISPPVKQAKVSQSHYHSSTANVLSSSNLRDDTKLLLGQISANSQSRTELTTESAVTDDAKQDEADRGVSSKEEASAQGQSRGPTRTSQEREKLLQRIESMRKERKVYSRFEVKYHTVSIGQ